MCGDDNVTQIVYEGEETTCQVRDLLPGRTYLFQVRATNAQVGVRFSFFSFGCSHAAFEARDDTPGFPRDPLRLMTKLG